MGDDYEGFDIEASKRREVLWKSFPDIDYNRIGRRDYWDEHVVPRIELGGYDPRDVKIACATGKKGGATSKNSVITRHLLCSHLPKDTKILDFGAGYKAKQSQSIKEKYSNVCAFDFQDTMRQSIEEDPELKELFDDEALSKDHDIIIASNVLNVQASRDALERTLNDIYCNMKEGSTFITNIPRDPIKYPASFPEFTDMIEHEIEKRFGTKPELVDEVCGASIHSKLLRVKKNGHDDVYCISHHSL